MEEESKTSQAGRRTWTMDKSLLRKRIKVKTWIKRIFPKLKSGMKGSKVKNSWGCTKKIRVTKAALKRKEDVRWKQVFKRILAGISWEWQETSRRTSKLIKVSPKKAKILPKLKGISNIPSGLKLIGTIRILTKKSKLMKRKNRPWPLELKEGKERKEIQI